MRAVRPSRSRSRSRSCTRTRRSAVASVGTRGSSRKAAHDTASLVGRKRVRRAIDPAGIQRRDVRRTSRRGARIAGTASSAADRRIRRFDHARHHLP
ncbi:hypothetical protein BN2475_190222 [Paraburkholderia ribeironis]|uniref:Uncharacterized protein n=1 Tax=Paraburkholderia ribeironis TaxID=1247936 RepID=A0A1N7RW90_9BURK|nr:hypothetical protein BN2475_190222 [Paraburkholderia ribeironis]